MEAEELLKQYSVGLAKRCASHSGGEWQNTSLTLNVSRKICDQIYNMELDHVGQVKELQTIIDDLNTEVDFEKFKAGRQATTHARASLKMKFDSDIREGILSILLVGAFLVITALAANIGGIL